MTTPLIILAILLVPLALATAASGRISRVNSQTGGLIGLAAAFVFFGVGHFVQTAPMSQMLPAWIPLRIPLIYATGALEWALAAGLFIPRYRRLAGLACIAVLIAFFPANIYAAINAVGMGGHQWGPIYLLIRTPLQIVLIAWAWWFAVRGDANVQAK